MANNEGYDITPWDECMLVHSPGGTPIDLIPTALTCTFTEITSRNAGGAVKVTFIYNYVAMSQSEIL